MAKSTDTGREVRESREQTFRKFLKDHKGKVCHQCGSWLREEDTRCTVCKVARKGSKND